MDKNHDDQCARVKDPKMGLFSSANSHNQPTTRNPVICQFRRKARLISTLLPVSYANSKICATASMDVANAPARQLFWAGSQPPDARVWASVNSHFSAFSIWMCRVLNTLLLIAFSKKNWQNLKPCGEEQFLGEATAKNEMVMPPETSCKRCRTVLKRHVNPCN